MKKEIIESLVKRKTIRKKEFDSAKTNSFLQATEENVLALKNEISLNEQTATIIFKGVYDSVRAIGDICWWLEGYEVTREHEVSLGILSELNLKESYKLNFLERFKKIRNDASYRGFKVSISQAQEILDFWDACMVEAIKTIHTRITSTKTY